MARHRECKRSRPMHAVPLWAVLVAGLSTVLLASTGGNPPLAEALSLPNHHQRRTPSTRRRSGPSTSKSPPVEPNTRRRRSQSRSSSTSSPLIVFYGSLMDRLMPRQANSGNRSGSTGENNNKNNHENPNRTKNDEELFAEDMRNRKQEFIQRYEHIRGSGRWGGYALQGIQQTKAVASAKASTKKDARAAPLPVVSSTSEAGPKKKGGERSRKPKKRPAMIQIRDIQHYKEEVVDARDASLVVVRFYASWCKACKAIESSFHRLPQEFPDTVKFVEVPLTKENAYLHKGLGVSSLPFAHVYYNEDHPDNALRNKRSGDLEEIVIDNSGGSSGEGNGAPAEEESSSSSSCTLVEELKISRNKFSEFRRVLRSYVDGECNVYFSSSPDDDDNNDNDKVVTVLSASPRRSRTSVPI